MRYCLDLLIVFRFFRKLERIIDVYYKKINVFDRCFILSVLFILIGFDKVNNCNFDQIYRVVLEQKNND